MVNTAEMGGRKPGEKPCSFSVTCSLLSQYLKEKGSFGDVGLGMTARLHSGRRGQPETLRTMNLLPGVEASEAEDNSAANQDAVPDLKKSPAQSMELFPQRAGFDALRADKKPDLNRRPQAAAAQMTIFYAGKVIVFDNFPVDKARELMVMAGRGSPDPVQVFRVEQQSDLPVVPPPRPSCPPPAQQSSAPATILASISEPKPAATAAATATSATPVVVTQEAQQQPTQPATSDLPIARRVSLHRFLEKRKDRINAKAPYQLNGPAGAPASSSASPAKSEEARQWLGLAPQASKPEDLHR